MENIWKTIGNQLGNGGFMVIESCAGFLLLMSRSLSLLEAFRETNETCGITVIYDTLR